MAAANTTKISWRLQEFEAHSSSVSCLALGKSSGRLLATGGEDCRVNIWAVSKANCIMGHTQAVRSLAFSPDGKWLASASDDCTVKLWDLTQGKTITEFKSHSAAVNIVQFHPNEYLLASGSSDRSIKLWDLEKFTMIGSLEGDTTPVSSDGGCLYSGATDSLRVFGWEPDRCFDVVPIGVSHQLSSVSSYVVDLKRVKKSGGSVIQGIIQDNQPLTEPRDPRGAALRRNYERPTTTCSSQRVKQRSDADRRSPEGERRSPSEDEADEKLSSAEIHNAEDYKEIFQPKNAISRTPPKISEPFPAPPEDETILAIGHQLKDLVSPFPDKQQPLPVASSTPVQRVEPTVVSCVKRPTPSAVGPSSSDPPTFQTPPLHPPVTTAKSKPQPRIILSTRNEPIGLNVADFLPSSPNSRPGALSDEEALTQIKKGHDTMCVMLSSRHKNLETVRSVWAREDVKIDKLLQSKYESYMQTGCTSLKLIMKHFWMLISDTLKASPCVGVDITREERHQKCRTCCKQLKNLSNIVKNKAAQVGRHGSAFKELQLLMAPLDDAL
ncbi:hypothetical protein INR49_028721 [Caranx melampygus]|nr:hypothetical protein INR49_028721 [Caranx melampygus]